MVKKIEPNPFMQALGRRYVAWFNRRHQRTGTLWENDSASASCDHGFASHGGVHVLYRDVLGLQEVDTCVFASST